MKKNYGRWVKILGLLFLMVVAAGVFIYISFQSSTYIISRGFIAGVACGIIIGAIIREKSKKFKRKSILLGIAIVAIFSILGWSFYTTVLAYNGSIYSYGEGIICGILVVLPIYLVVSICTCKNRKLNG